ARESGPARRLLAVAALRHIISPRSFSVLVPLLRDSDPKVRGDVPAALEATGGPLAAAQAIRDAMQAGYSTREAGEAVARHGPPPFDALLNLIARWNPQNTAPTGDTGEAVMAALPILARAPAPWSNMLLIPALCALLERRPGPGLAAAVARVLSA